MSETRCHKTTAKMIPQTAEIGIPKVAIPSPKTVSMVLIVAAGWRRTGVCRERLVAVFLQAQSHPVHSKIELDVDPGVPSETRNSASDAPPTSLLELLEVISSRNGRAVMADRSTTARPARSSHARWQKSGWPTGLAAGQRQAALPVSKGSAGRSASAGGQRGRGQRRGVKGRASNSCVAQLMLRHLHQHTSCLPPQ